MFAHVDNVWKCDSLITKTRTTHSGLSRAFHAWQNTMQHATRLSEQWGGVSHSRTCVPRRHCRWNGLLHLQSLQLLQLADMVRHIPQNVPVLCRHQMQSSQACNASTKRTQRHSASGRVQEKRLINKRLLVKRE